tara:strand:+ start:2847 stop:3287 length:441 start_codon:yes stop_codon:yes gene_type:complete
LGRRRARHTTTPTRDGVHRRYVVERGDDDDVRGRRSKGFEGGARARVGLGTMETRRRRWTSSSVLARDDDDARDGVEGEDAKGGRVDGRERWVVDPGGEDDDGDGGKPRVARARGVEKPGADVEFHHGVVSRGEAGDQGGARELGE